MFYARSLFVNIQSQCECHFQGATWGFRVKETICLNEKKTLVSGKRVYLPHVSKALKNEEKSAVSLKVNELMNEWLHKNQFSYVFVKAFY